MSHYGCDGAVVLLATSNEHKVRELSSLLGTSGIEVVTPRDLELRLQVEETGITFAENAVLKAEAFCRAAGLPSVADDSGIEVDALGGEPGIYSARFGGHGLDDAGRVRLLLERLGGVAASKRSCRFVAAIAFAQPGRSTATFQAYAEGIVTREPRGNSGFGYDPIFFFPPAGKTFAEMSSAEKALVSHRGKAIRKAADFISTALSGDILQGGNTASGGTHESSR